MKFADLSDTEAVVPAGAEALYENWHFAPAVKSGDLLFISGIIGADDKLQVSPDPEAQFVQVFETMGHTLKSAGLDFGHVVDLSSYHVDLNAHFATFTAVKDRYFHEPYPAWTAIGVSELLLPGALVEVRAIAKAR
jgi:enamine deaminase RidA (YjgF/YER057c/UK114 family)